MKGLIKKDLMLYSNKNIIFKFMSFYVPLLIMIFLVNKIEFIVPMLNLFNIPLQFMTINNELREFDRKYKVDKRINTFPVNNREIILARYISIIIIILPHLLITLALNIFLIFYKNISCGEALYPLVLGIFIGLIIFSLFAVTNYSGGTEVNGFITLIITGLYLFYILKRDLATSILAKLFIVTRTELLIYTGISGLVLLIISFFISTYIYGRKTYR